MTSPLGGHEDRRTFPVVHWFDTHMAAPVGRATLAPCWWRLTCSRMTAGRGRRPGMLRDGAGPPPRCVALTTDLRGAGGASSAVVHRRDHRPDAAVRRAGTPRLRIGREAATRRPRRCWSWGRPPRSRRACSGSATSARRDLERDALPAWRRRSDIRRRALRRGQLRHRGDRATARRRTEARRDPVRSTARSSATGRTSTPAVERRRPAIGRAWSSRGNCDALAYDAGFQSSAEDSLQPRPTLWAAQAFTSGLKSSGVRVPEAHAGGHRHRSGDARRWHRSARRLWRRSWS